jgi:hypothetical protein
MSKLRKYIEKCRKKEQKGKSSPNWNASKSTPYSSSFSSSYEIIPVTYRSKADPIEVDSITVLSKLGGGNFGEVFKYVLL